MRENEIENKVETDGQFYGLFLVRKMFGMFRILIAPWRSHNGCHGNIHLVSLQR
jgi:hypothetical protein